MTNWMLALNCEAYAPVGVISVDEQRRAGTNGSDGIQLSGWVGRCLRGGLQ